jgi:protein phosphatase
MKLAAASYTDQGPLREINADAVLAETTSGFFAVADGVGSEPESAAASRFAVDKALAIYRALGGGLNGAVRTGELFAAVKDAYGLAFGSEPPATTLTVGYLATGRFHYFNIGDSPVLLLSDGARLLTRQHTIVDRLMPIEDFSAMKSIRGSNVLFNYLGEPDAFAPEYEPIEIVGPTRFLLCSDGVFDFLSQNDLGALHRQASSPPDFVRLVQAAAAAAVPSDNHSLIVVDAEP